MKIRLLDYGGRCPERAHANDAGADVFSPRDAVIRPGEICKMPLGFGLLVPDGYAGFVFPKSGLSAQGIVCELPPVDSGYTGEIHAIIGENGAGKTTLMRVLTTVLKPTNGMVTLDGILYSEGNYEKIQRKIGYLPQEIELYPNLTVQECLEYMGDLAGVPKAECRKRIDYYLKKTSLIEHRKKKMKQLSGGMKRRVGLVQALLNEPEFLIVDEPTTGLDPEERIRIRNLLVDFSENRTVLFSTHVVEDLAATCNQLAIMHKGRFLYAGSMKNLTEEAQGKIWICKVPDERKAREVEQKYRITSKQYVEGGLQLRVISEIQPELECMSIPATLEDAYIYVTNQYE